MLYGWTVESYRPPATHTTPGLSRSPTPTCPAGLGPHTSLHRTYCTPLCCTTVTTPAMQSSTPTIVGGTPPMLGTTPYHARYHPLPCSVPPVTMLSTTPYHARNHPLPCSEPPLTMLGTTPYHARYHPLPCSVPPRTMLSSTPYHARTMLGTTPPMPGGMRTLLRTRVQTALYRTVRLLAPAISYYGTCVCGERGLP